MSSAAIIRKSWRYKGLASFATLLGSCSAGGMGRLAELLTLLGYDFLRLRRRVMLENLQIALPEMSKEQHNKIARQSFYNNLLTAIEFLSGWKKDPVNHIEFEGAEHLHAAVDQGNGAYILCSHQGNWEAFAAKVSRSITPARVLVKKVGSDEVNRFVCDLRERIGFLAIDRAEKGDGLRQILKALQRGEIVGFVLDQARPGSPKIPFFGKPAKTNTGLATLWLRRPAPIIPATIIRTAPNQHKIIAFPAVEPEVSGDRERDILSISEAFNHKIEEMIRMAPEQYFWMHNRWKD